MYGKREFQVLEKLDEGKAFRVASSYKTEIGPQITEPTIGGRVQNIRQGVYSESELEWTRPFTKSKVVEVGRLTNQEQKLLSINGPNEEFSKAALIGYGKQDYFVKGYSLTSKWELPRGTTNKIIKPFKFSEVLSTSEGVSSKPGLALAQTTKVIPDELIAKSLSSSGTSVAIGDFLKSSSQTRSIPLSLIPTYVGGTGTALKVSQIERGVYDVAKPIVPTIRSNPVEQMKVVKEEYGIKKIGESEWKLGETFWTTPGQSSNYYFNEIQDPIQAFESEQSKDLFRYGIKPQVAQRVSQNELTIQSNAQAQAQINSQIEVSNYGMGQINMNKQGVINVNSLYSNQFQPTISSLNQYNIPRIDVREMEASSFGFKNVQAQLNVPKIVSPIIPPINTPYPFIPGFPPIHIPPFGFPPFTPGGMGSGGSPYQLRRRGYKYQASFGALLLNIRAKRAPGTSYTGISIRPIVNNQRLAFTKRSLPKVTTKRRKK